VDHAASGGVNRGAAEVPPAAGLSVALALPGQKMDAVQYFCFPQATATPPASEDDHRRCWDDPRTILPRCLPPYFTCCWDDEDDEDDAYFFNGKG
jgi:hypothetical protein